MELLRVKALVHVDKWQPWLSALLKTKLVRYVDGVRETYTEHLYTRPEGDPGGYFAAGFLDDVIRMAKSKGIEVKYLDLREIPEHAYDTDPGALDVHFRFKQDACIKAITEHDKGIIKCPTGWGKSFVIKVLTTLYPNARFVICTEAASVVSSLYENLVAVHGKSQVGLIKAGTKAEEETKRIQVSTTKSILRSQIRTCDILLFDEVHNCGNNQITELLMNNVDHARMFGFTASLWRGDKAEALIKGLFGDPIAEATYQEAVEHNLVVPIKAIMLPCRAKERQVTDSMMLDKKLNYICNYGRNQQIADVAKSLPEDEQCLIMVSTFEHAVRLHQLLPEFTVCHGGNGVKVKRNRAWTGETAPRVIQAVHKSKGTVAWFVKTLTGLDSYAFERQEVTGEALNPGQYVEQIGFDTYEPNTHIATSDHGCFIVAPEPHNMVKILPVRGTGELVSFPRMFTDWLQMDGSPCGAPQMVDRNISGIDMTQYKMNAKGIADIRKRFESGELKKLIATNIFSEGVNFVHLKYLIRADGETSKISSTQIPGRLSRLCPGKDCAYLFDFVDHFSPWAYQRSVVRFKDYIQAGWVTGPIPERENRKGD